MSEINIQQDDQENNSSVNSYVIDKVVDEIKEDYFLFKRNAFWYFSGGFLAALIAVLSIIFTNLIDGTGEEVLKKILDNEQEAKEVLTRIQLIEKTAPENIDAIAKRLDNVLNRQWVNVGASSDRKFGIRYTNNTGYPIEVAVTGVSTDNQCATSINLLDESGNEFLSVNSTASNARSRTVCFNYLTIPDGVNYSVGATQSFNRYQWFELRHIE